jgi:hypothetical protein
MFATEKVEPMPIEFCRGDFSDKADASHKAATLNSQ